MNAPTRAALPARFLVLVATAHLSQQALSQTTLNWRDPDATSGNWSGSSNWWNGGSAQAPAGSEILRFGNNHQLTMTNDLSGAPADRYRIYFDAGATSSRTIGGSTLNTFYDFGTVRPLIQNDSTALHTLNFPMAVGASYDLEINPVQGDLMIGGTISVPTGRSIQVWGNNAKTLTLGGVVSGAGGIRVEENSTVVISQSNSFSGPTVINAGKITMGDNSALGTSAVTLNGGTLERNAAGVTVANNIAVSAGGGTLLGRQTVDDYTTFSGQLTGSGALTVRGLVTLNNTGNTYSGAITVSNATTSYLRLAASEVLGNTATVNLAGSGSYLRLDGGVTETIGGLSGSGGEIFVASAGNGTLKFGGNDGSTSFSGALSNGGSQLFLVKQGTGTFTFAPTTTTYAGLTVSKGTVLSTNANGGAGPTVTLGDTDTGANAVAFLTTSSGASRNITVSANGTGTATIGSTTGAGSGNVVFSGTTTLNRATTLTGASTDRTTWTGQITGNVGTLTIAGGNRIVFEGTSNNFTGNIAITGSNTVLQTGVGTGGEHIPNGSSVDVGSGTILKLAGAAGSVETIDALTGSGTVRRHESVSGLQTLVIGSANGGGTFSGILQNGAGNLALTKNGSGTQILSGSNSYSGTTTINAGTLKIGNMNALGAFQGGRPVTQVLVNSGGAIDFNGVNDATYGYTIAGTGVGGTGALVNTGSGIGNGIAQTSNIKLSADATVGGTGNWALLTNSHGATSLDLGGFTLTKAGSNTLSLANTTTTAGTVVLSAGTLQLGVTENASTAVNGAASAFAVNGGTLSMIRSSSLGSLTGTGGSLSVAASTTLTVGALNTSPAAFAGSVTLGSGSTLSKTGTGTLHLTGAGSGPATVSVGAGTFKVAGTRGFNEGFFANNDSVNYTVAAGATLEIAANYNTRSNNAVTLNGGTLHFSTAGSDNYLNSITLNTGTSAITSVGGFRGGYFYSPTTTVNAAASGSTISSALVFVNNGNPTWTFNVDNGAQAADLTVSGVMQDLSGWSGMRMVKSGTGTMALTAANTYTAETTVSAGTLALTGSGALSDSSTVNTSAAGAVFDISGISASSETIGALAGAASSSVVLGGKTLVAGASNASTSFAGAISGAGALTKTGTGTLTLSGANAHTGGTTISAGTIAATNSSAFSTGTVTLNGGTLNTSVNLSNLIVLNNTSNFIAPNGAYRILSGQITGAGGFKVTNGGGTPGLELNNPANNFAGNVEIDVGTYLRLSAAEVIPDTAVVVINGGGHLRLDIPGGGTETVAGLGLSGEIWVPTSNNNMHTLVVGAGNTTSSFAGAVGAFSQNNAYLNLVKTGSGTFTMSGASYFEGGTTVNGGTLLLNRDAGWNGGTSLAAGTGNITANSGTTLKNGTSHSIWGGHQNTRTVTLNDATVDLTNGQEYFYKLAMTGGTVHRGPSSFLFRVGSISGAGEITTSASASTALISSAVDMTFGSLILNVADGGAASDLTISGNITENSGAGSGAKSLTKNGAGTLTLSGSNSYSGTTTLNAGTLGLEPRQRAGRRHARHRLPRGRRVSVSPFPGSTPTTWRVWRGRTR
jgi:fibronectin-binding autotransporter adhesin